MSTTQMTRREFRFVNETFGTPPIPTPPAVPDRGEAHFILQPGTEGLTAVWCEVDYDDKLIRLFRETTTGEHVAFAAAFLTGFQLRQARDWPWSEWPVEEISGMPPRFLPRKWRRAAREAGIQIA
ncbi:MAG TPA: hypothetical protein VK039_06690 [Brevibacterium sp.]|nr:hypothetical protein [Brevibacterium sp.]